jgi:hypothetical protein
MHTSWQIIPDIRKMPLLPILWIHRLKDNSDGDKSPFTSILFWGSFSDWLLLDKGES